MLAICFMRVVTRCLIHTNGDNLVSPEEIKNMRLSLNMSQQAFSTKMGISIVSLSRWERGHARPSRLASEKLEEMKQKYVKQKDA